MTRQNDATGRDIGPHWLTVSQAAARLGVSEKTVLRRLKLGALTGQKQHRRGGGMVWKIAFDATGQPTGQPIGQTDRTDKRNGQRKGQFVSVPSVKPSGQVIGQPDNRPDKFLPFAPEALPLSGELEALRDALAAERESAKFLRSVIEQLQRDGAEVRAALRKALENQPKAIEAPAADRSPRSRETGAAMEEKPEAPDVPQRVTSARETGKEGRELTYEDIARSMWSDE